MIIREAYVMMRNKIALNILPAWGRSKAKHALKVGVEQLKRKNISLNKLGVGENISDWGTLLSPPAFDSKQDSIK